MSTLQKIHRRTGKSQSFKSFADLKNLQSENRKNIASHMKPGTEPKGIRPKTEDANTHKTAQISSESND